MSTETTRRRVRKAWNGGKRPEPRQLGTWLMSKLAEVDVGKRLIVQIHDGKPMAFDVLLPVAFEDSRDLYALLEANSGIACGTVIANDGSHLTLELT